MSWSIETDESTEVRRKSGAIDDRYQVYHPIHGLIETASTLADAFDIGSRYEQRKMPNGELFCGEPFAVEVYDRMAKRGRPRCWRRQAKTGTYHTPGGPGAMFDKYGDNCRWVCTETRPPAK